MTTFNTRIKAVSEIVTPEQLLAKYPLSNKAVELINETREHISNIIYRRDQRLLIIVGPCSIHDVDAALEYAARLKKVRELYKKELEVVMRVYFEKPRSTVGWKGLINDPDLDSSFNVNKGLDIGRKLLLCGL